MKLESIFKKIVKGAVFMSESDYPFVVKNSVEHQEINFDTFFDRLIRTDRETFESLKQALKQNLTNLKVTKTGSVKVTYEISGIGKQDGKLYKITTIGIET